MIPATIGDCAAWLHPAAPSAATGRGVVLVPAFGFEELCSRRSMRILADRLAAAGLATLRFDLHGTADSLGCADDPARLARWIADTHGAVDWLKVNGGFAEVALVGLRLGALIAARVAAERGDVARLGLMAPPSSGKAWIRETAALSRIIAPQPPPPTGVTVAGFHLSEATVSELKGLDWPAELPSPHVLVMSPGQPPRGLVERFSTPGAAVQALGFPGYERMICDPTASEAPFEAIRQIVDWARDGAPIRQEPVPAPPSSVPLEGPGFTEAGVTFGPAGRLAGVLCRPGQDGDRVVILTNGGGQPHIGWGGMSVTVARALARDGVASLRMDFSGLGDSRGGTEAPTPFYYDPAWQADIRAAVDLLSAQGFTDITVAGHCSGAHHAFHAGVADARVRGLILTNLQCFVWGPRYKLPLGAWMSAHPTAIDLKKRQADEELGKAARWQAVVTDRAMTLAKRVAKPAIAGLRRFAGRFGKPDAADPSDNPVAAGFEALSRRGARVLLCYSEGDPGLEELALHMGPDGAAAIALPGVTRRIIADTDHLLAPDHARAALLGMMRDFMARQSEAEMA